MGQRMANSLVFIDWYSVVLEPTALLLAYIVNAGVI